MKEFLRTTVCFFTASFVITAITACGNTGNIEGSTSDPPGKQTPDASPPKPVTVTMFNQSNGISDDRLQQFILEPLKQKLPHVTFEVVKDAKGSTMDELVATGNFTDINYGSNPQFPPYLLKELQYDMNDLVKKHNLDLNRFDPAFINAVKTFDDKGKLYAIPFSTNLGVLIYNKDIFDRFGVAYPKDGMTWDETVELGRKLTRTQDGINYIGFDPGVATDIGQALSLSYVDTKSMKAMVNNDQWKKIFDMLKRAYAIPGFVNAGKYDYGTGGFIKDHNVAMRPIWALQIMNAKADLANVNWDVVSLPNFKEELGQGREVDIHMLAVSNVSKNKDAAMEVIKAITSDEVQRLMSEYGTPTVMKNEEIKKAYGSKLPEYKGKNVQAFFKTTPRVPHVITRYDATVRTEINNGRKEIATGDKDVNTVIREIQEKADQKLAEMK